MSITDGLIFGLFLLATSMLAVYGLHLYVLLWLFRRRSAVVCSEQADIVRRFRSDVPHDQWPNVTSQIPLYNERDVSERIIRAVAAFDYPRDKHEIQVLDDSDDGSSATVDRVVDDLRSAGVDIITVRRADRSHYKAGALEVGVRRAKGEYLAVFDADFIPPIDFLLRSVPLLESSPDLACLQGRWSHINEGESWITRAQALGIDGHFAVEQGARAWNGLLMNFNGTAGIWRKAAIDDPAVGGWSGDTLTEDLDLSYRAQLAGWRIDYSLTLDCPAELPGDINAFKSQQRRWATGSIQVAVKLLRRIWSAPLGFGQKIEATLHLTHYSVSVWMLILAIVARPMLIMTMDVMKMSGWFWVLWGVVILSAIAPAMIYGYARWSLNGRLTGFKRIPQLMALGCGMCVNNSLAVIRGLFSRGGEFVRTPKSGSEQSASKKSSYAAVQSHLWIVELFLAVYSFVSFGFYVYMGQWPVSVFLLLYGAGFLCVGLTSRPRLRGRRVDRGREAEASVANPALRTSLADSSNS